MLEISSVGAKVKYAVETTAETRPTSGYKVIPNISEAPEISMEREALDASDISDEVTRYIPGRADPGGNATFTANHTEAFIDAWSAFVKEAKEAYAEGRATWIEYWYPGAKKSFYYTCIPHPLGNSGITQNEVDTIPAPITVTNVEGWAAASTEGA